MAGRQTLAALVAQAYPAPEWAVFYEVSNTVGFGANRRADAVALGVWPSRGQTLVGFEFKSDRGDWLREMRNPAKAETIASQCDCWWLVTTHASVAKPEELPEPWGLYVASEDGSRLKIVKQCKPYPDRDKTTMKRAFVAAMLRKVPETTVPKAELKRLVEEGVGARINASRDGETIRMQQETIDRLTGIIETFKAKTGVNLQSWTGPEKIGAAVAAVLDADRTRRTLAHSHDMLVRAAKDIEAALAAMPKEVGGDA